ncbi:hypothetical protein CPLU01_07043 [Colletotrichum plurivorum]|uniref:Uncharacterized protein n=1 Tax=Colletotrichum plurivorum TaxID=2175906 RepID=A0A8H6NFS3_9PEZI|nr:hypothetical protein CPLU01_07043 [Colletotrichum plurivorum]
MANHGSLQPPQPHRSSVHQMFSPPTSPPAAFTQSQPAQHTGLAGQSKRRAPVQQNTPPARKQSRTGAPGAPEAPRRQSQSPALSPTPKQQDDDPENSMKDFKKPDWAAAIPRVLCEDPKVESWYNDRPNTNERPGLDEDGIVSYARENGLPLGQVRALAMVNYEDKWQPGQAEFSCGFCCRKRTREHFAVLAPQECVRFPDGTLDRYSPNEERDDLERASAPMCPRRACVKCGIRWGLYRRDDKIMMEGRRVVWICHCKNVIPLEVDGPGQGEASCASCRRQSPLLPPNM